MTREYASLTPQPLFQIEAKFTFWWTGFGSRSKEALLEGNG